MSQGVISLENYLNFMGIKGETCNDYIITRKIYDSDFVNYSRIMIYSTLWNNLPVEVKLHIHSFLFETNRRCSSSTCIEHLPKLYKGRTVQRLLYTVLHTNKNILKL